MTLQLDDVPRGERDVARLVADGLSDKATALALGVSVWTVRAYLGRLSARLGSDNDRPRRQVVAGWYRTASCMPAPNASVVPAQQRAA
jgi:DNA-binding NarL/FixJ family response regulator